MMKKFAIAVLLAGLSMGANAAGGGAALMEANVNLSNKVSLQRGARLFVNYCLSCHSAEYMRYIRMADDLELDHEAVKQNMMFTTEKIGETMRVAMRPDDASNWLGAAPPDLSVMARAKGADYIFSYLNGFYADPSRVATGVNNLYYPGTSMPHILWELQGRQELVEGEDDGHGGHTATLELTAPGTMTPEEYQQATRDLTAFMVYMGEPAKLVRYRIGFWVIVFLSVLLVATYLLKQEYWKDVH